MGRKRYTEEQIIGVLNEAEAGARTADLCRKHGMSEGTFYKWKAKYAGLTVSELKRLKPHEYENRRLKHIVAQQALDNWALKELLGKDF
jgi:putative transposase